MVGRLSLAVCTALIAAFPACLDAQAKPAVQMPGDNGKLGVPYRLGAKGEELVFILEKVEFASRALMKDTALWPKEGERLLILTYAVQNPGNTDRFFFNQSLAFTVVSPDDENYLCDGGTANGLNGYHPDRRERLSMQIKPAQKVRALTVVQIHPKGPVNKLIVQRGKGTPVLRYDLRDKVKPMAGAYAANNGMEIRDVGTGMLTVPIDFGVWDMNVKSAEDVPTPIGGYAPDAGWKWVVLTVTFTNSAMYGAPLHSSMVTGRFFDADGGEQPQSWLILKASTPEPFSGSVEAGASVTVRMLYRAPLAAKASHVIFRDASSYRTVNVKLEKPEKQ